MLHPFGYHSKREQCLVETQEWEEVGMGKPLPNDRLMAKFLYIRPPLRFRATVSEATAPALTSASPSQPSYHQSQRRRPFHPVTNRSSVI